MARTDSKWNDRGTYIETARPDGYDLLINGSNHYLNFNTVVGSLGYGFRDNSGVMEFKNSGGSWDSILGAAAAGSTYVPYTGAIANVDLGIRTLSASGLFVSGANPLLQLTGDETNDTNGGTIRFRTLAGSETFDVVFNGQSNAFTFTYGSNLLLSLGQTVNNVNTPSSGTGGISTLNVTGNTWSNSTLVQKLIAGSFTLTQTGTAGFNVMDFSIAQTTIGTGEKNLLRFSINGSSKFVVDYRGAVTLNKTMATTPVAMLDIVTDSALADTVPSILAGKAVTSGNSLGASFRNLTGTTGNAVIEIAGISSGAARGAHLRTDSSGNFGIYTGSTAYGTLGTQRLYITQAGSVGIGTTTTISYALQIDSTSTNQFAVRYSASQYMKIGVNSVGYTYIDTMGTSPQLEFRVGGNNQIQLTGNGQAILGGNTGTPVLFINGADTGTWVGAGYYNTFESGIYSTNGDEVIAAYDLDENRYHYFNRALYGNQDLIASTAQFNILNGVGSQLGIGFDYDNMFYTDVASDGNVNFYANSLSITPRFYFNERVVFGKLAQLASFTVSTLPAGEQGDVAYVTDALAPVWNATVVGGGTVKILVQYDGTNWKVA
jgi:hypothetical protein